MLPRQTQTAAFWRDQFEVTSRDLDFIYTLLLDAQTPKTVHELALALIEEYIRRESAAIETELAKGAVYVPKNRYKAGQTLVFPALDFAAGEVVSVRPGQNPEHGEFDVLQVAFANSGARREFAAGLATPHRLNEADGDSLLRDESLLSPQEIYSLYSGEIDESILFALEEGDRSDQFVSVEGKWLLADMLAEVDEGHLNIAEALIDMNAEPQTTDQLLAVVELDANVSLPLQRISLEHGLAFDQRFDRVQRDGQIRWFLNRMEPAAMIAEPLGLRPEIPH